MCTVCRAICAWSIGGDLSAFVLCVEPFGCGHQVWPAQYCMLSHFFGHRGDLMAFVICVKAGLIWHGLQSSEEIVRGPAL